MSEVTTAPLIQLVSSELNVRKTDCDLEIKALAEDIHAHGLKQNLVVVPSEDHPGKLEVVAGGRRHRALQILMHDFRLAPEWPVPVLIEERAQGRETSLSENLTKIAMNPADEFEAFATIVAEAEGTQEERIRHCAKRFGTTEKHVEQRLRLADLAPPILEALRAGDLSLDAAKAYATYSDHTLQLAVFDAETKRSWGTKHEPKAIRDALKSKTYPAKIAQAVYVGHLAYLAAGGRIERELFMGADEDDKLLDPAIVDRLAREKAAGEIAVRVKQDGFASGLLTVGFVLYPNWPKAPAGFSRAYGRAIPDMSKKEKTKAIGVYSLKSDGSELECVGCFEPIAAPTVGAASSGSEYARQQAAQRLENRVVFRAAQLALAAIDPGTLLTKLRWPEENFYGLDRDEEDEDIFYVDVQLRVTRAELDAMRAAAEEKLAADIAADEAAAAEEQQARAAAADASIEPTDG